MGSEMTTSQTVRALALIIAAQARIAGMQAANLDRQMQGYSLAYSEEAFFQEAGSLEQIAEEVISQWPNVDVYLVSVQAQNIAMRLPDASATLLRQLCEKPYFLQSKSYVQKEQV